jgi:hypothetical protein
MKLGVAVVEEEEVLGLIVFNALEFRTRELDMMPPFLGVIQMGGAMVEVSQGLPSWSVRTWLWSWEWLC